MQYVYQVRNTSGGFKGGVDLGGLNPPPLELPSEKFPFINPPKLCNLAFKFPVVPSFPI